MVHTQVQLNRSYNGNKIAVEYLPCKFINHSINSFLWGHYREQSKVHLLSGTVLCYQLNYFFSVHV